MKIQRKSAVAAATDIKADEGVVVAVVSVTGTVDEVKDIIEPGAYSKTLAARKPKVVWSHDWNTPIGRVDEVKELMPGDPMLPKTLANGDPWPREAGALVVKAQFNLETQRGREAFSDVKFYGSDGAWSIGYNVPPGGATVEQKTGIRRIKHLDLFEVSPVLHGAHTMAGTVSVKSRRGKRPSSAEMKRRIEQRKASRASLDRSPDSNWVEESGELPGYIREIARAIERDSGKDLSSAIAIAISRVKKWAAGGGDVDEDTRAKAAAAVAEWEALKAKNAGRDKEKSRGVKTEKKYWSGPSGSIEERLNAIREALSDMFKPVMSEIEMSMAATDTMPASDVWIDLIGTFDDHVIAAVYRDGKSETYKVGYTVNADGSVTLGTSEEVELETVIVPKTMDVDESLPPLEAAEKAVRSYEVKAGRVLSSANATRLKAAVEELVKVLQAAGVDVNGEETKPATVKRFRTKTEQKTMLADQEMLEFEALKLVI